MQISLNVPDELAVQLRSHDEAQLSKIFELGLRELNAQGQPEFEGISQVLEFLASLPTPEEIIALCPSEALQSRVSALLEKNQTEGLSLAEERDWEQYQYLEHLVRLAKAKAYIKLKNA